MLFSIQDLTALLLVRSRPLLDMSVPVVSGPKVTTVFATAESFGLSTTSLSVGCQIVGRHPSSALEGKGAQRMRDARINPWNERE